MAETAPTTAYEFISELQRLFGPAYRPSPGGVYPAIAALTAERLLRAERDGRAKRYSITAAGRKAIEKRRGQLAAIEARTATAISSSISLRSVLERFTEQVMQMPALDPAVVELVLDRAVRQLQSKGAVDATTKK